MALSIPRAISSLSIANFFSRLHCDWLKFCNFYPNCMRNSKNLNWEHTQDSRAIHYLLLFPLRKLYSVPKLRMAGARTLFSICACMARIRSILVHSMWDLWWTQWHWAWIFDKYFSISLSVSFHLYSIFIFIYEWWLILNGQVVESCEHTDEPTNQPTNKITNKQAYKLVI
jgi:hypothetical protein